MKTSSRFYWLAVIIVSFTFAVTGQTPTDVNGWQEARWGMTETELVDAFKSRVTKLDKPRELVDNKGYANYAIKDYEIEGNKFTVYFDMDMQTKKLMRVRMSLNDDTSLIPKDTLYFSPYDELLTRKYGTATFKNDDRKPKMITLKRQWAFKTTTVELTYVWASMGNFNWLRIEYYPSKSGDVEKI